MKRIISLLLCLCLMGAFFATPVWADEEEPTQAVVREPGQCGEELYWNFENGVLTVSGTGGMDDFEEGAAPWAAHKSEIKSVVLKGVSYIGANAFRNYDAIVEVDFGSKLYEIGPNAFRSCDGLTTISLPASFKVFGESSFMSCPNLKTIHCAGRFPSFRQNSMWDTRVTIYYPAEKPWSASTIEELETAFKGRVEFLASDGKDPVPNEPDEPEETVPAETEPVTEPETTVPPAEEVTTPPADVTDTPVEPGTEIQEDVREDADEEAEADEEEEEEKEPSYGIWIGLTIVAAVLVAALLGLVLVKPRGKYAGRR